MAALTLVHGTQEQQALARDGIAWLAANPDRWTREVEFDRTSGNRPWKIPVFSLGLRATLHPRGRRDVAAPATSDVVAHLDDLWDDQYGAWADEVGSGASTAGSYGAVMAMQALKEAFRFDPSVHLLLRPNGRRARGSSNSDPGNSILRELRIDTETRYVSLTYVHSAETREETFRDGTGWKALLAVASRYKTQRTTMDKGQMSVSLAELVTITDRSESTVRRAIARINARFGPYVLLDLHTPGGTRETKYIIENTTITIDGV